MRARVLTFLLFFSVSLSFSLTPLKMVRTRYVELVYEKGLEDLVLELLERVDEIYERLTGVFGVEPYSRLKVFLIDRGELANAYADPVSNVIVIYPNELFVRDFLPKYKSWVEYAFVHELTHILVGTSRRFSSPMTNLFHNALVPVYLHEGLAVLFESEEGFGRLNDPIFRTNMEMTKDVSVGFSASPRVFPGGGPYVLGARFVEETLGEFGREKFMNFMKDYLRRPQDGFARVYFEHFGRRGIPISSRRFDVLVNPKVLNGNLYYLRVNDLEEGVFKHREGFVLKRRVLDYTFFEGKMLHVRFVSTVEGVWTGLFEGEKLLGRHVIRVNSFGGELVGVVRRKGGVNDVVDLKSGKVIFEGSRDFNPLDATPWKDGVYFIARKKGDVDLFCVKEGKVYRITEDGQTEFNLFSTEEGVYLVKEDGGKTVLLKIGGERLEVFETDGNVIGGTEKASVVQRVGGFTVEALKLSRRGNLSFRVVTIEKEEKDSKVVQAQDYQSSILPRLILATPFGSLLGAWDDLAERGIIFVASPWFSSIGFFFKREVQLLLGVTLVQGKFDVLYSLRVPLLVASKQSSLVLEGTDEQALLKLSIGSTGGGRHAVTFSEYEIVILPEPALSCGFGTESALFKITFSLHGLGTEIYWPIADLGIGTWDGSLILDGLNGVVRFWLGEEVEFQLGVRATTVVGYNSVLPLELLLSWKEGKPSLKLNLGRLTF